MGHHLTVLCSFAWWLQRTWRLKYELFQCWLSMLWWLGSVGKRLRRREWLNSFALISMAGHRIPKSGSGHFYSATKCAVTALTEGTRMELRDLKSNIRVTVSVKTTLFYISSYICFWSENNPKFYLMMENGKKHITNRKQKICQVSPKARVKRWVFKKHVAQCSCFHGNNLFGHTLF